MNITNEGIKAELRITKIKSPTELNVNRIGKMEKKNLSFIAVSSKNVRII
jgi:hypothetical protein